jgi:hypothetical protein
MAGPFYSRLENTFTFQLRSVSTPSNRTMALGSTQPLTEMSTRNLSAGKWQSAREADSLTGICEPIV